MQGERTNIVPVVRSIFVAIHSMFGPKWNDGNATVLACNLLLLAHSLIVPPKDKKLYTRTKVSDPLYNDGNFEGSLERFVGLSQKLRERGLHYPSFISDELKDIAVRAELVYVRYVMARDEWKWRPVREKFAFEALGSLLGSETATLLVGVLISACQKKGIKMATNAGRWQDRVRQRKKVWGPNLHSFPYPGDLSCFVAH